MPMCEHDEIGMHHQQTLTLTPHPHGARWPAACQRRSQQIHACAGAANTYSRYSAQWRKKLFPSYPNLRTAGWQLLDDFRAQRDQLRTAAARIGLLDPQLASCKREASEQTVQAASWTLKARQLEMPAAAQTAGPRLAHQGSSKSARAASACTHGWR